MSYGKPILYPLIAIPFFLLFGRIGFLLLNGLFLGGSIALCYLFLRRYFSKNNSLFIALAFFFCSFMPAYVTWIHPEMMLFFACSLCMWLWLCKNNTGIFALLVGIASSVKIVFLLLLLPFIIISLFKKQFKQLFKAIAMCILGFGLVLGLTYLLLKQFLVYSGPADLGFITSSSLAMEDIKKSLVIDISQLKGIEFSTWKLFFRNMVNFFAGRFTGIFWYAFPGLVCLSFYLFNRKGIIRQDRLLGDGILVSMLLLAVVLVVARPLNYFGGEGFICNRYFFIVPALLFLPTIKQVKNPRLILLFFLPGLLVSLQVINNYIFIMDWDHNKQWRKTYLRPQTAHAASFPLKFAPLEIAQLEEIMIHNLEISKDIFLYAPAGIKNQVGKRILVDAGQEAVIVQKDNLNSVKLATNHGEIILEPKVRLKSKTSSEFRGFYYFKAKQETWINRVYAVN